MRLRCALERARVEIRALLLLLLLLLLFSVRLLTLSLVAMLVSGRRSRLKARRVSLVGRGLLAGGFVFGCPRRSSSDSVPEPKHA